MTHSNSVEAPEVPGLLVHRDETRELDPLERSDGHNFKRLPQKPQPARHGSAIDAHKVELHVALLAPDVTTPVTCFSLNMSSRVATLSIFVSIFATSSRVATLSIFVDMAQLTGRTRLAAGSVALAGDGGNGE